MPGVLVAQGVARTQVRCAGQRISAVEVRAMPPSFGTLFEHARPLGTLAARAHARTRPEVARNFVLLAPGQRCSPLRRSESERILRAMPFIADATVAAYADGPDAVKVEVTTVDEPSFVGGLGVRGEAPFVTRVIFGNANLGGNAVHASGQWREGFDLRDALAGRYTNYQLWGRPYQLDLRGGRRELGHDWSLGIAYPFLTDLQRAAWRVEAGVLDEYPAFLRPDLPPVSIEVDRRFFDAGFMGRVGPPGQLGLLGLQFSVEDVEPGSLALVRVSGGVRPDTTTVFRDRYEAFRSVRVNALLGFRRVRFVRVNGFDAVEGPQDLATGLQLGATAGYALPASTGMARGETYVGGSLFAGAGTPRTWVAVEADVDARRGRGGDWRDVLLNGRAALYLKPAERHLSLLEATVGAGWETRIPYQLRLGDRHGGLPAWRGSSLAGARRGTARLEERLRLSTVRDAVSLAAAVWTDAGAVVRGDAPLGTNSGVRHAVGAALLLAVPPRSQRTWRVDVALPVSRRDGGGLEVRVSSLDRTRAFWTVPPDVRRTHERVLPQSVFSWP